MATYWPIDQSSLLPDDQTLSYRQRFSSLWHRLIVGTGHLTTRYYQGTKFMIGATWDTSTELSIATQRAYTKTHLVELKQLQIEH